VFFVVAIIVAVLLVFGGFGLSLGFGGTGTNILYLVGALVAQVWLVAVAMVLRAKRTPRFDMLVAAEVVVALGIFSLILGIAGPLFRVFNGEIAITELSAQQLAPVVFPFAEGLVAAGTAPLLSTFLRQSEVLLFATASDADQRKVDGEMDALRQKVIALASAVGNLTTACERNQAVFEKSASSLNHSSDAYTKASNDVSKALSGLASTAQTNTATLATAIQGVASALDNQRDGLGQSAEEMTALTGAIAQLHRSATEATSLLDGLQKLIAQVDRFIKPDAR
jgi:methyl-accepting chemotaxis protein